MAPGNMWAQGAETLDFIEARVYIARERPAIPRLFAPLFAIDRRSSNSPPKRF